jgi:hypothetical protein
MPSGHVSRWKPGTHRLGVRGAKKMLLTLALAGVVIGAGMFVYAGRARGHHRRLVYLLHSRPAYVDQKWTIPIRRSPVRVIPKNKGYRTEISPAVSLAAAYPAVLATSLRLTRAIHSITCRLGRAASLEVLYREPWRSSDLRPLRLSAQRYSKTHAPTCWPCQNTARRVHNGNVRPLGTVLHTFFH